MIVLCTQVLTNPEKTNGVTVIGMVSQGSPVKLEVGYLQDKDGEFGLYQEGKGGNGTEYLVGNHQGDD